MAAFNQIILLGNLTRDPVMQYLPSQMQLTEFGMAVNKKFRTKTGEEKEKVLFVDCKSFGKTAELINQYCQKGSQVHVIGELEYETWEDKQGGGKRSKHIVNVARIQFLNNMRQGQQQGQPPQRGATQGQRPGPRPSGGYQGNAGGGYGGQPPEQPFGDEPEFKEDDIPF